MAENFGEDVKFVREEGDVLLKLYHKNSAIYFSIWLTSRRIDYRFIITGTEDDFFYDPDVEEYEYLFWIEKSDWNSLKDDICWEQD
ncbi:MAG TPA: hypothetical protein VMC48_02300 [Methanobacterium sp.]|nr:hypothetical protein [Methanobacterium sp.]